MAGSDRVPDPKRFKASPGWNAQTIHQSEMALFNERMQGCSQNVLDSADIVRDGDFAPTKAAQLFVCGMMK